MTTSRKNHLTAKTYSINTPLTAFQAPRVNNVTNELPSALCIFITSAKPVMIPLDLDTIIALGRGENEALNRQTQYIDLAPYDGKALGVSRRHANIFVKESKILLRDTQSSNGTFLNGRELYALRDYELNHGDLITFGKLHLSVQFKA